MFYPIIDQRISRNDRRQESMDRRTTLFEVDVDRRKADRRLLGDRRKLQLDRKKLLENLQLPIQPPKDPHWLVILRPWLMPLVLAIISSMVTWRINTVQTANTNHLSKTQIRSSENIADASLESSRHIAEANLETQNLGHIIELFTDIIVPTKQSNDEGWKDPVRHRITALEAYDDQSLPFLLQLESYYEKKNSSTSIIAKTAKESIIKILSQCQTDLTGKNFLGEEGNMLNIRFRSYADLNLSESRFERVNLYSSDFPNATLIGAKFYDTDLVKGR